MLDRVQNKPSLFPAFEESSALVQMSARFSTSLNVIPQIQSLPFVRSVLRHVALESTINVVGVVARNAASLLLVAQVLSRHQRLWTFDGFVFGAILRRIVRTFLVIGIPAVHATNTVPDRSPKKISAQIAVGRSRVRVLLETMRM